MIQRIQTVYLFFATLVVGSMFFFDFAELAVDGEFMIFNAMGIFNGDIEVISGLPVQFFLGLITLLNFSIIFLFKKRILQIRVTVFTIILLFGLLALLFYFIYISFENASIAFKIPLAFPLVAVILDYLAIRGIGKDEALIRSMNRIR